jgi:hypothetical protein
MFVLFENLNSEWVNYKKIVEQAERENLMASLRDLNGESKMSAAQQAQYS